MWRLLLKGAGKWLLIGALVAGAGATVMYYVQDYVERGVALKGVETTQKQDETFRESVESLTQQKQETEQRIQQSVNQVENPDEVADPGLVRHVKRLLDGDG